MCYTFSVKNPKVLIPILSGVLIGVLGIGVFLWSNQTKKETPPAVTVNPTPTEIPVELSVWKDQAGFAFQYPSDLSINAHEEDKINYAHVELTHKDHSGGIIVWAKDLPAPNLSGWINKDTRFSGGSVLDTTLGNLPAKKILLTDPKKAIIIGAFDAEVLVTIEGDLADEAYWSKVHQIITDSFTFTSSGVKPDETSPSSVSPAKSADIPSQSSGDSGGSAEEVLE